MRNKCVECGQISFVIVDDECLCGDCAIKTILASGTKTTTVCAGCGASIIEIVPVGALGLCARCVTEIELSYFNHN